MSVISISIYGCCPPPRPLPPFFLSRCRALIKDLKDHKGSGGRDQQYLLMAMDVLGKVAGGLADITRCDEERSCYLPPVSPISVME